MDDAVIRLGDYSFYVFGLLAALSFLWGAFVFYKKSISSHFEDTQILDSIVISAFWSFILGRLFFVIYNWPVFLRSLSRVFLFSDYSGIDRWGVYFGIFLGAYFVIKKFKNKLIDWFDLISLGVTSGTTVFFAGLSFMAYSWQYGVIAVAFLLFFILSWNVENKYRKYDWYRANKTSARSGLVLGMSISSWGLVYLLEKLLNKSVLTQDILWSIFMFVGGMVLVYIRSGRTVAEDIKLITNKNGKR